MIAFTPTLRTLTYDGDTTVSGLLLDGKAVVRLPDLSFLLGYTTGSPSYDMARWTLPEEKVLRTHFYNEDGSRNRVTMFVDEETALALMQTLSKRRGSHSAEEYEAAKQWLSTVFFPWLRSTAPQLASAAVETGITAREQVDAAIESLTGALQVLVAAREQLNAQ